MGVNGARGPVFAVATRLAASCMTRGCVGSPPAAGCAAANAFPTAMPEDATRTSTASKRCFIRWWDVRRRRKVALYSSCNRVVNTKRACPDVAQEASNIAFDVRQVVRKQLRTGAMSTVVSPLYQLVQLGQWQLRGRSGPTPHIIKERIVRDYAHRYSLRALIETGTYLGDMIWAMRKEVDEIHSIELER